MKTQLLTLALFTINIIPVFAQTPIKLSNSEYGFNEGPVWDRSDKIYFSDISKRKVFTYSVTDNTFATAFDVPSPARTNGLMFNSNLDLIVCDFRDGNVTNRNVDGTILNTYTNILTNPNDLCVDKKNGVYVSSPGDFNNNRTKEIYYINADDSNTTTLLDDSLEFPNGILISTDGKHLFVTDSGSYNIFKFDIDPVTAAISNKSIFATLSDLDDTDTNSRADGMALDTKGNLYVAAKKSIQVFDPTGSNIKIIDFEENPTNCTFGGSSLSTLFVTTPNDLYKIEMEDVVGFQHPFDLPESVLSVDNFNTTNPNIKVFPNPTNNHEIEVSVGNLEIKDVELYNTLGQYIGAYTFSKTNNSIKIHLDSNLKKGTYILTLKTIDGQVKSSKVMLQ
ncbi:SMP-30/gluconolactonase/LRE family protein [Formosa sp. PL04]|uniref:SMP-30/gluconolactonase/LRE family protein n=1 Tax=Formosa sp. PL04 TaxID=3081755 RepID=UPI002982164E|nr:SMP-30/gluconolactonase/LRE family protein [Formosa sp. PL04]MDW5288070.1 SMP-30/gluconolactonase/LRE family protein [Formosa sp. PL04]